MSSQNIRKMVTTAILIALTVVFQLLRPVLGGSNIISTYIIGSLINLSLIVAACVVGLWSGVSVAVITPIIALLQNHKQLPMIPWIIVGNLVLVVLFALWAKKDQKTLKIEWVRWMIVGVVAAVLKYAVITLGQTLVQTSATGNAFGVVLSASLVSQFVQVITALVGTVLGGLVIPALPANAVGLNAGKA